MYTNYFGLKEAPFNANPDPRFLHLTPTIQVALDELTYGIHARKGLILLTGEAGTGKTMLIHRLLAWLQARQMPTAYIFNSHLEANDLLELILSDFHVPKGASLQHNSLLRLNQWLIQRYEADETPVLIVDEAQGLPTHVLEEVRMLLNLETPHQKLLQIVLVGQPELEKRLRQPELRQLKQRIMLRCKTAFLNVAETSDYVHARLKVSGAGIEPIFSNEATDAVYRYSNGIPRIINVLCEHALINGYADQVRPIPGALIREVAEEFQLVDSLPVISIEERPSVSSVLTSGIESVPVAPVVTAQTLDEIQPSGGMAAVAMSMASAGLEPTLANEAVTAFSDDDLQVIVQAVAHTVSMPERKSPHVIEMRPIGAAASAMAKHAGNGHPAPGPLQPRRHEHFSLRRWSERCSAFVNYAFIAPLYGEIARAFSAQGTSGTESPTRTDADRIYWASEPLNWESIRRRVSQWLLTPWSPLHVLPAFMRTFDPKRRTLVAKRS